MGIDSDLIKKVFPLPLEGVYIGAGQWRLTKPFEYVKSPVMIKVPIGFITDGASIPKFAWSWIGSPWSGKYSRAAVVHDYGYFSQARTRKDVDYIFLEGMKILDVPPFNRWIMYHCVRMFAWLCWKKRKEVRKNLDKIESKCYYL